MIEQIRSKKGKIMAIIVRKNTIPKGVRFFTPPEFSQQIGLLSHEKGTFVKPHMHKVVHRDVAITQEVFYVKKGKIAVYLYDEAINHMATRILKKGDIIILAGAGHGIRVLEKSLILEVKQGPYMGIDDKVYIKEKKRNNDTRQ